MRLFILLNKPILAGNSLGTQIGKRFQSGLSFAKCNELKLMCMMT